MPYENAVDNAMFYIDQAWLTLYAERESTGDAEKRAQINAIMERLTSLELEVKEAV